MTKNHFPKTLSKSCLSNPYIQSANFCDEPLFLNNMINYITDELVIIDEQGRFICVNDAAVQGLGYSRQYIFKKTVVDFLKEKMTIRQWKKQHFDVLKSRRTPISYRIERVAKGNDTQILDITAMYIFYQGKEAVFSFGRNVTRQVQMQRALKDARDLYHFLTEGAGDGIAALDRDGRFIYANQMMREMFGLNGKDCRGKKFISFVTRPMVGKVKAVFEKVLSGESQVHGVVEMVSLKGEAVPIEISITPLIKAGKTINMHMIIRDLRPRRNMEQMERQAEKIDALRQFVFGTAQELKNPLMGVVKRTDVLLAKYGQRDFEYISYHEFQEMMSTITAVRDQIQYCYKTVQRLTTMGQRKAGMEHGHCQVNRVIKGIITNKEEYMRQHGVHAKIFLLNRDVEVRMGSVDLIQVLSNLIDNAVQAMHSGGTVTIRASVAHDDGHVMIDVKDRGIGIPQDQLEHIFEPFFTTKSRGVQKNSGLGLPIVHSLVRASQGDMRVSSSLRNGTTVTVSLPIYRQKSKKG